VVLMRRILVYFYNEEIEISSTTSVTRLVASLIESLDRRYEIHYFSFEADTKAKIPGAKRLLLKIPTLKRAQRKINNALRLKRIHWHHLKKNAAKKFAQRNKEAYDAVLVLGLDDVSDLRKYFPASKILYWIHNISAICKKEYLHNVNDADYFLSPSRTTYKLLLQKLQPVPLTAEFRFFPNWCEDVFKQPNQPSANQIKEKHSIPEGVPVFIFSGSDLKLKGKFIIEKAVKSLAAKTNKEIIFLFAGSKARHDEYREGCIRVIYVGLLSPDILAAYYHVAHFGCFASLGYDHCPLTLLEMVNCNVLPLASNVGSVKEILGQGYNFFVEEPHSVSGWINVMQKAIHLSGEEREEHVAALKEKILATYDRNIAVKVFEEIMAE
jgi:glycosyltransferase involved in cell wall biosynthesis